MMIETFSPVLPLVLPYGWHWLRRTKDGGHFVNSLTDLSVIVSGAVELDGKRWVHLSCAARDRLPTWNEMTFIKELVLGREATALQVIPPRSRHVNLHPYCLHLWCCLDGDMTPDFTRGAKSL